ncbi:SPOC domain-containing protein [Tricladium varicosporioides]|nr:SPOC domain-containing protein [Hymenoscyphus varicosporioides]
MADEPRRSVRATKGQHTKSLDLLDQPAEPKKKSTKKSKKAAEKVEEEEVEVIRCVCGAVETGDDEGEPWIACDSCGVWQHNVCVGISRFEEDAPANYRCEQCDPQFPLHKELLDGLKHGRKLWEERRKEDERTQAEKEAASKKKGKKGKGKRTSDQSELSHATNGKAKTPPASATPTAPVEKKEPVSRAASMKRKTRDESHDKDSLKEPQAKVRKVSSQHPTPQRKSPPSDLPVKISELESTRQGPTKLMFKNLQHGIKVAIQNGVFTLSTDDTIDSKAERLAIQVENAIYTTHGEKSKYAAQARGVGFNLKQNQELVNNLLTRILSPASLAVMSSDDMASKELKRETAEMKARAEKQSILLTDDNAPRVRRTHKGDEIIEGDDLVAEDTPMTTSRRRSMLDPNAEMATRSRENSPGNEVELPEDIMDHRSRDDIRGAALPKQPLSVETKPPHPQMRKSSSQADFDINKVFSSVQSPVNAQHVRRPSTYTAPPANGPGVDPEIDKLLQDDDGNESPPYSPAEYSSDPEIVWRGSVTMDSIAKFPAVAKHVGGADLSSQIPWTDLLQKELKVAGRIDQGKANEYLCGLRYSAPTDIVIVAVTPTGEAASQEFQTLFDYFHTKKKYGVLTNKSVGNIRDTYLIPVSASPSDLPDFLPNIDGHQVPENRPEPMILVTLVIRNEYQPDPTSAHRGSVDAQSPSVMGHPQRQMSISGAPPAMSPINPQGGIFTTPPIPQTPQFTSPDDRARQVEEQRRQDQQRGEQVAREILQQHIAAPTVAFLMPQAYQMRPLEWQVIKDILEKDEKARVDLQHLSQVLEVRMSAENENRGPGS